MIRYALILFLTIVFVFFCRNSYAQSKAGNKNPVIVVTDLYHPYQDCGDNYDLITAYALPEIDLKAIILDCTEVFRKPLASNPGDQNLTFIGNMILNFDDIFEKFLFLMFVSFLLIQTNERR